MQEEQCKRKLLYARRQRNPAAFATVFPTKVQCRRPRLESIHVPATLRCCFPDHPSRHAYTAAWCLDEGIHLSISIPWIEPVAISAWVPWRSGLNSASGKCRLTGGGSPTGSVAIRANRWASNSKVVMTYRLYPHGVGVVLDLEHDNMSYRHDVW
jgi:hypothetical protein